MARTEIVVDGGKPPAAAPEDSNWCVLQGAAVAAANMPAERRFDKAIDSLTEIHAFLKGFVEREALGERMEFCLTFVVEEIFTNMVKYNTGSSHQILIQVDCRDDGVTVELTDFDVDPFDPATVEAVDVDAPLERRRPGGLGLHLVKSVADRLTYEYRNREMKVSVYKRAS